MKHEWEEAIKPIIQLILQELTNEAGWHYDENTMTEYMAVEMSDIHKIAKKYGVKVEERR